MEGCALARRTSSETCVKGEEGSGVGEGKSGREEPKGELGEKGYR